MQYLEQFLEQGLVAFGQDGETFAIREEDTGR